MKKNKTSFTMSLILLAVSVIFTLLVAFVGKAPVGPENSEVGFAALNAALHDQFGYNTVFYGISSVLGYLTILTARPSESIFCLRSSTWSLNSWSSITGP